MHVEKASRMAELAHFVKVRRLRLNPAEFGIKINDARRRTSGLRREELGVLAGLSGDWIARLEQGRDIKLSRPAAQRLSRALRLEPVEAEHLLTLCEGPTVQPHVAVQLTHNLEQIVQHQGVNPCYVTDNVGNLLVWNIATEIVFGSLDEMPVEERNRLRLMFLNADVRRRVVNWEDSARRVAAQYRREYDRKQDTSRDAELVDELRTKSPVFNRIWADHIVLDRASGRKVINHPEMGQLTFDHSSFKPFDSPNLSLTIFVPAVDPASTYNLVRTALERREKVGVPHLG